MKEFVFLVVCCDEEWVLTRKDVSGASDAGGITDWAFLDNLAWVKQFVIVEFIFLLLVFDLMLHLDVDILW